MTFDIFHVILMIENENLLYVRKNVQELKPSESCFSQLNWLGSIEVVNELAYHFRV